MEILGNCCMRAQRRSCARQPWKPVVGDLLPQTGHCRLAVGRWPAGGGSPSDMGWMIADSCDGCAHTPEHKLRNTIEGKPSDDTYRTN